LSLEVSFQYNKDLNFVSRACFPQGTSKEQVIAAEGESGDTTRSTLRVECVGSQQWITLQGVHCSNKKNRISLKLSYEIQFQQSEHVAEK